MKVSADLKQQINSSLTKREAIATQILAGLVIKPYYQSDAELVKQAIALADLLLKTSGGK